MCAWLNKLDIWCSFFQFDEEFLSRQEAQAQLVKCEEKIAELQAELQAFRSQVLLYICFYSKRDVRCKKMLDWITN